MYLGWGGGEVEEAVGGGWVSGWWVSGWRWYRWWGEGGEVLVVVWRGGHAGGSGEAMVGYVDGYQPAAASALTFCQLTEMVFIFEATS